MSAQLIENLETLILDAAKGLAVAHPGVLTVHEDPTYLTRAVPPAPGKVALVSGGGAGHEPLHTGFVGTGMLDAAVPGAIFASPTAHQIHAATVAVDTGAGVVHIVKNYTGDRLNFSMAAELAADEGTSVEQVLVDDDLATDSSDTGTGRRGTAAVLAVEKLCGAAAERGDDLRTVAQLGRNVAAAARTYAFALAACTHPGDTQASFDLQPGEVELGVGIHGERGRQTITMPTARELLAALIDPIIAALDLKAGENVLLIVNGLGSTTNLELDAAHHHVRDLLDERGISVARDLVGSYVTALDMAGVSVTLIRLAPAWLELWDAPVRTPALSW